MESGNFKDVESMFKAALNADPDNRLAHMNYGDLLSRQKRTEEAFRHLSRALELSPTDYRVCNAVGEALARSGDFSEAARQRSSQRNRVESYGPCVSPHACNGSVYGRKSDPLSVSLEFRQALRLRPDYWESYNGIGIAYDRLNNVAAAAGPRLTTHLN